MSQREESTIALPILAAGGIGGVVASLFCFCWVASLPAGAMAVRWTAKERVGSLSGGSALAVGAATGLILGLVTASLGTALFLASLDPSAMDEAAAMTESMLGESTEVSLPTLAVGHAMVAFVVNLVFGMLGGLLGAASVPGERSDEIPPQRAPAPTPAFRFEPPPDWRPAVDEQPTSVPAPRGSTVSAAGATPPETEEVSRDSVPPEAFVSAWTSAAAGGTPRVPPKQAPPPEDEASEEPDEPTLEGS